MRNRKKNRKIPDHIILNVLNKAASAEDEVLDYYEDYIREVATEPVYSADGSRSGYYYYDEDLAQELRLALAQALPALRETLIKNHLENRPVTQLTLPISQYYASIYSVLISSISLLKHSGIMIAISLFLTVI